MTQYFHTLCRLPDGSFQDGKDIHDSIRDVILLWFASKNILVDDEYGEVDENGLIPLNFSGLPEICVVVNDKENLRLLSDDNYRKKLNGIIGDVTDGDVPRLASIYLPYSPEALTFLDTYFRDDILYLVEDGQLGHIQAVDFPVGGFDGFRRLMRNRILGEILKKFTRAEICDAARAIAEEEV